MNTLEGKLVSQGIKVGIVAARFNEFITSKLISGAMDGLLRHDVKTEDVDVAWVPGAFEIPLIAQKMAESGKYDAVICLGSRCHLPLRFGMQRGGEGRCSGWPEDRRARAVRCGDNRHHRAGN